jgi:two-component system, NtrC family, sensor kinase
MKMRPANKEGFSEQAVQQLVDTFRLLASNTDEFVYALSVRVNKTHFVLMDNGIISESEWFTQLQSKLDSGAYALNRPNQLGDLDFSHVDNKTRLCHKDFVRIYPVSAGIEFNCQVWQFYPHQIAFTNAHETIPQLLVKNVTLLLEKTDSTTLKDENSMNIDESLEFLSPFYTILRKDGSVVSMSHKLKECTNWKGGNFNDKFEFIAPFNFDNWIASQENQTARLYFFSNGTNQRFKFSAKKNGQSILLVCTPVINQEYPIANYGLTLSSFGKHDYISEFLFLQQTTSRALEESQNLISKIAIQNNQLFEAKAEIEAIAKFPEENPNPILRFDLVGNLLYKNKATTQRIEELFQIKNEVLCDTSILESIRLAIDRNISIEQNVIHKGSSFFSLVLKVVGQEYVNLYITEITDFINELSRKESELSELSQQLENQREFYEYILNNLPADIAVFNLDHTYKYVNPKGIKNPEVRAFIIGKDDYDYCRYKGISTEIADKRRALFNTILSSEKFVEWEDATISKDGKKEVILRRMAPLFDNEGKISYVVGYGTDITARKIAEQRLKEKSDFQELLTELSTRFINLSSDAIDASVTNALETIGIFLDIDRAYVCEFNRDTVTNKLIHNWKYLKSHQHDISIDAHLLAINAWVKSNGFGKSIQISGNSDSENNQFPNETNGIITSNMLALPLMNGTVCEGYIVIESDTKNRIFSYDEESLLLVFAQMLVNLRNRVANLEKLKRVQGELENINANLEMIIDEQTANNNSLIQTLYNQDKLALVGEISAGIAHDLNTPLGVIKIGAESVYFSLNKIFNELLSKFDFILLQNAIRISQLNTEAMPMGGMQTLREKQRMLQSLAEWNVSEKVNHNELAQALVNIRLGVDNKDSILEISQLDEPIAFLELIFQLRTTFNFLQTMQSASRRSAEVVKTLKSYLRADTDELIDLNIDESLKTVIQIFAHELKYKYTLIYNVPATLIVKGYESKLFQLWSNIIKNALEAMPDGGELEINAEEIADSIQVRITNTGEMIPMDIQERIFEKFFTTKSRQNGTGLGLSIVKKIADEHQAKLSLSSTDERTSFQIVLPMKH